MERIYKERFVTFHKSRKEDAKKVLLTHGAGGRADQYRFLIPLLQDEFDLFSWDWKKHGNDHGNANVKWEELSTSSLVDDYKKVVDCVKPNFLISHSYGTTLTILLLTTYKPDVERVCLMGLNMKKPNSSVMSWTPCFVLEWMRPAISNAFRSLSWHPNTREELIMEEKSWADEHNEMWTIKALLTQMEIPPPDSLKDIKVPVLLLSGETDGLTPSSHAEEMSQYFENSAKVTIENSSHQMFMEQPKACAEAIKKFLF